MRVYNAKNQAISLARQPIGKPGCEGIVYPCLGKYKGFCVKIFHPGKIESRIDKLQYMIQHPITNSPGGLTSICWPMEFVRSKGNIIGYLMPLAPSGSHSLYELCTPRENLSAFHRGNRLGMINRHKLLVNIAATIYKVHQAGYVIADFKPENILFEPTGIISMIDMDSVQIAHGQTVFYPPTAITPDYAYPKELPRFTQKKAISKAWDSYSFGIVAYQVLLGLHPYTCSTSATDDQGAQLTDRPSLMRNNFFVFGRRSREILARPKPHDRFLLLSQKIRQLFLQTFDLWQVPPDIEEWGAALYELAIPFAISTLALRTDYDL